MVIADLHARCGLKLKINETGIDFLRKKKTYVKNYLDFPDTFPDSLKYPTCFTLLSRCSFLNFVEMEQNNLKKNTVKYIFQN